MGDNILYHYTSLEVLNCLFENYSEKDQFLKFWATNCSYMNDPKEIKEGIELIKETLNQFLPEEFMCKAQSILNSNTDSLFEYLLFGSTGVSDIPYSISFSKNKDNLNMWRMYGDSGKGIALGLNRNKLYSNDTEIIDCTYNDESENYHLKNEIVQDFISLYQTIGDSPKFLPQEFYEEVMTITNILRYLPQVKNPCYKYERETRIIKNCDSPNFRVSNGILIPYTTIKIPIDALQKIVIGPDCDKRNINSLKIFFLSKGLENLCDEIIESNVPYHN